jgi:hypothetical protein
MVIAQPMERRWTTKLSSAFSRTGGDVVGELDFCIGLGCTDYIHGSNPLSFMNKDWLRFIEQGLKLDRYHLARTRLFEDLVRRIRYIWVSEPLFGGDLTHHGFHATGALADIYLDFHRSSLTTLFTSTEPDTGCPTNSVVIQAPPFGISTATRGRRNGRFLCGIS